MNVWHRRICASPAWAETVRSDLVPWVLDGSQLGDEVLEVGPGFGATTRVLVGIVPQLVAVEIDVGLAARLGRSVGDAGPA